MSKSTTRQRVETLQGWLAFITRTTPKKTTRVSHESKPSLDQIMREHNK
jgi:hypothetical protein